jgi:hypothetical protein
MDNTTWKKHPNDLYASHAKKYAYKFGWIEIAFKPENKLISFMKEVEPKKMARINIYYTTKTVGTCLDHPKKGKTQLFRKNVSIQQLEKIFANPRTHTDKGYYQKKDTSYNK